MLTHRNVRARVEADKKSAFELTRQAIGYRILQLLQLPLEAMSDAELQKALTDRDRTAATPTKTNAFTREGHHPPPAQRATPT